MLIHKIILSLILLCLSTYHTYAQDIIVTNNGDIIKAYNLKIGPESVFYSLSNNTNSEIQKISKIEILAIKKENGEKIVFDNSSTKVASTVNNVLQSVKQTLDDVKDQITSKRALPENYRIVSGDPNLPIIDISNYHGFLLQKGNVVYVQAGLEDYDEIGANRLRELLKGDGFWKLSERKEQAHFIIKYRVETKGSDHIDQYYLNTREGLSDKVLRKVHNAYEVNGALAPIHASEDLRDNIKFADSLYERIVRLQKYIVKTKNPEKKVAFKPFCQ